MATTTRRPLGSRESSNRWLSWSMMLNWEVALYIVILLLAVFTRFYMLGERAMSHDESLHTRYSWNLYAHGDFDHTPLMHGPILFHVTAFFYFLFGDNDSTARIYTALLGVALVMFPLLFRRWLGRWGAILASFMLLISPLMMYYNRYIREDTPSIFYSVIMVYCIFMYLDGPAHRKRKAYWLYILVAAMLGSLGSKETAFIYIAIFGIFLALYWLIRLAQHFWHLPGKTIYYFLMMGILVAGVLALGMYIVLAVIPPNTAAQAAQASGSWFNNVDSSSLITWTLLVVVTMLVALFGTMLWAFRESRVSVRWVDMIVLFAVILVVCLALIYIEELSHVGANTTVETAVPVIPGQDGIEVVGGVNVLPLALAWGAGGIGVLLVLVSWRLGWWRTLHRFPELDLIVVIGSLILPWATPFIIKAMGVSPTDYTQEGITRAVIALIPMMTISILVGLVWNWRRWLACALIFYALFAFFFTTMFTNMNGLASGMIGSLGYWLEQQGVRRGSQPQYYYLGLIMPFYEFLPVLGSILAMFSGLGIFWRWRRSRLEAVTPEPAREPITDHSERVLDEPAAEPVMVGELVATSRPKRKNDGQVRRGDPEWLARLPFLLFVSWWAILNLVGYTLAGEKMPWLGTHLTLPLIFLAGWYFGRLIERIDRSRLKDGGWIYLVLFPLLFVTLFQVIAPFIFSAGPFTGLQQAQLAQSGQWLAVVAVSGLVLLAVYQLVERTGWRHLRQMFAVAVFLTLSLLTTRSALLASFINYDLATEYLVYAHAAPAVKQVLNQIEEISLRTTDGKALSFSYDNEVSWPYTWYFRDYPNATFFGSSPSRPVIDGSMVVLVGEANRAAVEPLLEDRFYHFEYIRLWWPMQDYFNLTPQRIANALDFSPENFQSAQIRQGLFNIWWSRNYDAYGEAVGRNFDVTRWPVSDRMHFYVRKDLAAQIWNLGVGEGLVGNPLDEIEPNVCNDNWQLIQSDTIYGAPGSLPGQLNRPLGVAVDADGMVYIAEEGNNRISIFNPDGTFNRVLAQDGEASSLSLTRPNGVALGPGGNIYIADTWNYRIQAVSPQGELLSTWGERGEFGANAQQDPVYGLWGPRELAVDADGRVYVADTGNKRIRVYTQTGEFVRDIGSGGSSPGQLDEPVGLALHPDGRLYVADTWNRRITVFNTAGTYLYDFPVRGWYEELGNRPYVALDADRGMVYATDPDAGRILVYDDQGNCVGSFGQASRENPGAAQFRTVGGIEVDALGNIYAADVGSGRVLRFPPFPAQAVAADEATDEVMAPVEATAEVTDETAVELPEEATSEVISPEATEESTAELTPEVESNG